MKDYGKILRNEGMQMSLFNANEKVAGWSALAMAFLEQYLVKFPFVEFQAEDLRKWAYRHGLKNPPSERAWGSIIRAAKKSGLIQFVRYENVDNPLAHKTPASVWCSGKLKIR